MSATLYVIPGSHPAMTARLMLERKGIPYKRRDLIPVVSRAVVRAARFPGTTVPALTLDGARVQGSTQIARELDRVRPDPRLFPEDPEPRTRVEEVERWGESVLQASVRRISLNALRRDGSPLRSYAEGARLGVPLGLALKVATPIIALSARLNEATDENVRADLAALPEQLDRIDAWIDEGAIGGAQPNAADYQLATSLRLLLTMDDLRRAIAPRPAGELAMRLVPDYPGHVPPTLPAEWLAPLAERR